MLNRGYRNIILVTSLIDELGSLVDQQLIGMIDSKLGDRQRLFIEHTCVVLMVFGEHW